ncbi:MAG TPA: AMP-binding protein [Thermodesulfobacteriota bacterium]|nr:AMP-binding protein [Thermodesulfobacteriota bacterium]
MEADTIPKLFFRNVREYGHRVALREKDLGIWKRVTWGDYYEHTRNFAMGLKALGFEPGDKVSILGDNCREWLYTDIAAQSLRGIAVGIYPTDVAIQVKYILKNSDSRFVIARDQEQVDKVFQVKNGLPLLKKVIVIDMKGLRRYKDPLIISFDETEKMGRALHEQMPNFFEESIRSTQAEDVAIIVYTSGTTGDPKGAMISHKGMISMVRGLSRVLEFRSNDSVVSVLPLCHIAERMFSLIFPMYVGYTVNFAESVNTLQEDMKEISPTAFLNVPRIWEKMHSNIMIRMQDAVFFKRWVFKAMVPIGGRVSQYRLENKPVPLYWRFLRWLAYLLLFRALKNQLGLLQAHILVSGAAPLSPDLIKFYHSIGVPVRECYGMTEMSGISFMPKDHEIRVGGVGKPISGVEFKLGEDGEIFQKGDSVFVGYYGNPRATQETIVDGWLHTGDVGQVDEEGILYLTDRKKDIIITAGGKNIAPSEIENKLKFSPFIKEAIVIGDRRKYLSCLIQIDLENVSNWAQNNKIAYTTYKSLATHPDVNKLIGKEVEEVNKHFSRVESIKKFKILEKELDPDDEELTATMKVKRAVIEKKFKDIIEAMY